MELGDKIRTAAKEAFEKRQLEIQQEAQAANEKMVKEDKEALVKILDSIGLTSAIGGKIDTDDIEYFQTQDGPPYAQIKFDDLTFISYRQDTEQVGNVDYELRCRFFCPQCNQPWLSAPVRDMAGLHEVTRLENSAICRVCSGEFDVWTYGGGLPTVS